MQIDLHPNELKLSGCSASYQSPGGKKFNGKLTITDKRLLYDVVFDMDAKGAVPDTMFIKWGSVGYIEIDKADIKQVEIRKSFLTTKLLLVLYDGSKHIFNPGFSVINFSKALLNN